MSHSAMSSAEMALPITRLAGKKPPRNSICQMCSIRLASQPTRSGLKCSMVPITASSRPLRPDSPTPSMPSSVSTVTNRLLRAPLKTGKHSTLVIFMFGSG